MSWGGKRVQPTGKEVLRDPALNKGTALSAAERRALGLDGPLPPVVTTETVQASDAGGTIYSLRDMLMYVTLSEHERRMLHAF